MNLALRVGIAFSVVAAAVLLGMGAQAADPLVRCGTVSEFSAPTANSAGSFVLTSADTAVKASVAAGTAMSALAGYRCVELNPGAPSAAFVGLVAPGQAGYVAESLPSGAASPLAKAGEAATSLVLIATALVFFSILVVFASYGGRWGRRRVAVVDNRPYNSNIRQRPGGVRTSHR